MMIRAIKRYGCINNRTVTGIWVDGDDAINKSATEAVTWMTIDYNMPGMDGITLATTLRERFPNATIALVTANIQDSIRRQADEIGMQFIQKPITEDKIRTFIGG